MENGWVNGTLFGARDYDRARFLVWRRRGGGLVQSGVRRQQTSSTSTAGAPVGAQLASRLPNWAAERPFGTSLKRSLSEMMVARWIRAMVLRLEPKSLRQRMIAINMITTGVTLLLVTGALVVHEYQVYRSTILEQLTEQARLIGRVSAPALLANDRTLSEELMAGLKSQPDVTRAAIFTGDNDLFAEYRAPNQRTPLAADPDPAGNTWES
jgi:hypothetical protein